MVWQITSDLVGVVALFGQWHGVRFLLQWQISGVVALALFACLIIRRISQKGVVVGLTWLAG